MKSETARQIVHALVTCSKSIEESIKRVKASCGEQVFVEYRRVAGRVMGYIVTNLLGPLYDEHPDLAPDWYNKRTPTEIGADAMSVEMRKDLIDMMDDVRERLRGTSSSVRHSVDEGAVEDYQKRLGEVLELLENARCWLSKEA